MNQEQLQKVQKEFLEIALEVKRVCDENHIRYFLCCGTFLGAVRHQGFIPWDDDMDLSMLREDYEKFRKIAPEKLRPEYCFQDWHTEPGYPHPFGKVRKRGTRYVESKGCPLREDGFYVDIFPIDFAPDDPAQRKRLAWKQLQLYRLKLMKSGCKPWMEGEQVIVKKRIGYLLYQLLALFTTQEHLIRKYDRISQVPSGSQVYEETATPVMYYFPRSLFDRQKEYSFVGVPMTGCEDADTYLKILYGDYMKLPPVEERENRHQIRILDFGTR